jgi:putative DNA primase/helicase
MLKTNHAQSIGNYFLDTNSLNANGSTNGADARGQLTTITAAELLRNPPPPRENILNPWLPRQGLTMIHAKRGCGKTHIALGIAYAVATGTTFLRWQAEKASRVLYVDGEMCSHLLCQWIKEIAHSVDGEMPDEDYLRFITPDNQRDSIPDLASSEGQRAIEEQLEGVDLLILDNKSTLCRTGDENAAQDYQPVQEWLLNLRRQGKAVLLIHHSNKAGGSRGTSMMEVPLDTVINLRQPSDYEATKGLCVEVHYEKNRAIYGEAVEPFEVSYETRDGVASWQMRGMKDADLQKVVSLANEGLNQRDIARELDMSLGKVNRLHKEAVSVGLIKGKG